MEKKFSDHFSGHAEAYARSRPTYPTALFEFLAGLPAKREAAWDCGCGNGQAAQALATRFPKVLATDSSFPQLRQAVKRAGIVFAAGTGEAAPIRNGSIDLVTVAQALHWFDFRPFFHEVSRVASPGAVLAVWAYGQCKVIPEVDAAYRHFYADVVGPYWPPERRFIESGYRDIEIPFPSLPAPEFAMEMDWELNAYLGYLDSWSATQRYRKILGRDPLALVRADFAAAWGDPSLRRRVQWPLALRVARLRPA